SFGQIVTQCQPICLFKNANSGAQTQFFGDIAGGNHAGGQAASLCIQLKVIDAQRAGDVLGDRRAACHPECQGSLSKQVAVPGIGTKRPSEDQIGQRLFLGHGGFGEHFRHRCLGLSGQTQSGDDIIDSAYCFDVQIGFAQRTGKQDLRTAQLQSLAIATEASIQNIQIARCRQVLPDLQQPAEPPGKAETAEVQLIADQQTDIGGDAQRCALLHFGFGANDFRIRRYANRRRRQFAYRDFPFRYGDVAGDIEIVVLQSDVQVRTGQQDRIGSHANGKILAIQFDVHMHNRGPGGSPGKPALPRSAVPAAIDGRLLTGNGDKHLQLLETDRQIRSADLAITQLYLTLHQRLLQRAAQASIADQVTTEGFHLGQERPQNIQLDVVQHELTDERLGTAGVADTGLDVQVAEPAAEQLQAGFSPALVQFGGELQGVIGQLQLLIRIADADLTLMAAQVYRADRCCAAALLQSSCRIQPALPVEILG